MTTKHDPAPNRAPEPGIVDYRQHQEFPNDRVLVARIVGGQVELFEVLMRRHNQRLFRIAMSIVGNPTEAEDVMQEAFVSAFRKLSQWRGSARFSTWLSKIAVYEALRRRRARTKMQPIDFEADSMSNSTTISPMFSHHPIAPDQFTWNRELLEILEHAVHKLPQPQRSVFVLRDVERLSTEETAECLSLSQSNVKVLLYRARKALRRRLERQVEGLQDRVFDFHLERCHRVVEGVFQQLVT